MVSSLAGRICAPLLLLGMSYCAVTQEEETPAFVTVAVSDTLGGAIPNARVHALQRLSKNETEKLTDETGTATLRLQSGKFDLTVTGPPGFRKSTIRDVDVKLGEHRRINVVLKVLVYDGPIDFVDPTEPTEPESAKLGDLAESTQSVSFCQLVSKPELSNGKEVFVQATYNGGNEWSVLDSRDCSSDKNLVWLEPSNDNVKEVIKLGPKRESVRFDLRVRGIFMSGGNYGDRGRYSYKIVASEVSKVEKLPGNK